MCCRRHGRRGPLIVVLGKMAYDKYQQHKAEKRAIALGASEDPNYGRIEQTALPGQADSEILAKAGINPPSYNDVVIVERATVPPELDVLPTEKRGLVTFAGEEKLYRDDDALSDTQSFYDVADGLNVSESQREVVYTAQGEDKQMQPEQTKRDCRTRCEHKKAAKAARRAEKKARGGCCC